MNRILYIDATARENSRTKILADHLLSKLDGKITHITLCRENIIPLFGDTLKWRSECAKNKDFSDKYFRHAKQFAEADLIVMAAPYWDSSFPAVLKKYIEAVSVYNLTFRYSAEGNPVGLCKAKTLYYVTTAGGYVCDTYGYGYISELAKTMFGIKETMLFKAEGLDITGADTVAIIESAIRKIDTEFYGGV